MAFVEENADVPKVNFDRIHLARLQRARLLKTMAKLEALDVIEQEHLPSVGLDIDQLGREVSIGRAR